MFSSFSPISTLLFHTQYLTLNKHTLAGPALSDNLIASKEMKVKDIPPTFPNKLFPLFQHFSQTNQMHNSF